MRRWLRTGPRNYADDVKQIPKPSLGTLVAAAFAAGAAVAFVWRLVRPHPASEYRAALEEQRLADLQESALSADTFADIGPDDLAG